MDTLLVGLLLQCSVQQSVALQSFPQRAIGEQPACLCRFFDAQNKKVGMPLRLLVGTEEWIVPYDGYTPRWQDLCDPRKVHLLGTRSVHVGRASYAHGREKFLKSSIMAI